MQLKFCPRQGLHCLHMCVSVYIHYLYLFICLLLYMCGCFYAVCNDQKCVFLCFSAPAHETSVFSFLPSSSGWQGRQGHGSSSSRPVGGGKQQQRKGSRCARHALGPFIGAGTICPSICTRVRFENALEPGSTCF